MRARGEVAGPALAALVAVAALGITWSGLYAGVSGGRIALLVLVACLPALASLAPRRTGLVVAGAVVVSVLLVLAMALRLSPLALPLFDAAAWEAVRSLVPDGLATGSDSGLPVDPASKPSLVALLDVALAVLAGAAAWQILARRRPVAGLVLVGVGLAYRWTVEPPSSGAAAGALALAALLGVLALSAVSGPLPGAAMRRGAGALAFGGVAIVLATGLASGPAQAGDGWWSWKDWEIGATEASSSSGLDLRQQYGKLDWPTEPRVALTVDADDPYPLRAVSLDDFDGMAFTLSAAGGSEALPVRDGLLVLPPDTASADAPEAIQEITLRGARSQVVLASGRPRRVSGRPIAGSADLVGDAIRLDAALEPGDTYTVRTGIPAPRPADLAAAPPYVEGQVPAGSTTLRPGYWDERIGMPLWGSGTRIDPRWLGAYGPVAELARQVAGDAPTAYAAVNRIEAHLRRGYVYDEAPPYPTSLPDDWTGGMPEGDPPLVDFLFGSRRGFCQHFAGSMAVMLRTLGIPARVAVGYTGGRWDADEDQWVVLDRDAHSWVEVWFPDLGWIPFDPTPGRSAPNPASVSSPDYNPTPIDIDLGGLADSVVAPPIPEGDPRPADDPADPAEPTPAATTSQGDDGPRWPWVVALVALVLALVAPAVRLVRRLRGRWRGDERARIAAATADLEASLGALGWAPPAAAAPSERASAVRAATGVDPSVLYRRASLARYGAEDPAPGAGAAAWRESGRLRRAVRRRASSGARLRTALGLPRLRRATVDR
ncbi:MAG: transglutaminase family protein [Thermoleophilia bacterium]